MNEARIDRSQPGDGVEAPRSSSREYINTQAGTPLDQDHENEMQHGRLSPSTLPTTRGSNLREYTAISQPLLDHENEVRGIQRQRSLTIASNSLHPIRHDATPAESLLHREKLPKTLPGWPSSPEPIKAPIYIKVLHTIFDILLFTCSVSFLVFALVVNVHDQDSTAENPRLTTTLLNATKYGPTVFPILFASVVGRAAHAILLWRLEKGERIGILDTLASSTSLTSTVTSQLQLRSFSILGVALLIVWSLSPIGGQASVRIMTIGSKDTQIHETLWYMVNNGYLGSYSSGGMYSQGTSSAGAVFVAALMGSPATKASPLDLWGNVKIPRIEGYEGVAQMDGEGWYDTDGGNVDAYSSLIGIPITRINDSKFIDYFTKVQSPYLSLQCSITAVESGIRPRNYGLPGLSSGASSTGSIIFWDIPNPEQQRANSSQKTRDRMSPEKVLPLKIKYVPLYDRSNFTLTCNVTQSYIEAEVRCPTPSTCVSSRIRRSKLNHLPSSWTLLDLSWRTPSLLFGGMLSNFNGTYSYPQLFDRYLSDPYLLNSNYANVSQTTEDKATIRLGQMLNAYLACLNGFFAVSAGVNNDTAYFWDNNQTFTKQPEMLQNRYLQDPFDSTVSNATFKTKAWSSEVTKTERKDVIVAHRAWVVALCFASIVLILASLVAPVVHYCLTVGVDIAMNISSLATRDNPYMDLPQTGTHLDASDRARLLRDHKVRFGEAEGAAGVSSLVMGSVGGAEGPGITRVRKGRLYE
ncbi:hypothetical protein Alg130_11351 [Pyrenophora tritici-repentis]|nr:hypothetical protein Alg130_11351 [Pyrenophora tritici-repentis]